MAKARKGGPPPSPTKKKARVGQIILIVVVLAGMAGAYVLYNQGSSSETASTNMEPMTSLGMQNRMVLPASPRNPRPVTLDPALFPDPDVKHSYQVAKDDPEPLENVACYCGCFGSAGHRNNLDCFKDGHGST